jgi:hypothetical protein
MTETNHFNYPQDIISIHCTIYFLSLLWSFIQVHITILLHTNYYYVTDPTGIYSYLRNDPICKNTVDEIWNYNKMDSENHISYINDIIQISDHINRNGITEVREIYFREPP